MTQNRNLSFLADNLSSTGVVSIPGGGTGAITATAAFNNLSPITTKGDIIVGDAPNSATRLAIGPATYILTSNGSTATWSAPTTLPTPAGATIYAANNFGGL